MSRLLILTAFFIHLIPIIFQIWAFIKRWQGLGLLTIAVCAAIIEVPVIVISLVLASKSITIQGGECFTPIIGMPLLCIPVLVAIFGIMIMQYIVKYWPERNT
jgi:hypothetical protein